jgi:hypothetical protein
MKKLSFVGLMCCSCYHLSLLFFLSDFHPLLLRLPAGLAAFSVLLLTFAAAVFLFCCSSYLNPSLRSARAYRSESPSFAYSLATELLAPLLVFLEFFPAHGAGLRSAVIADRLFFPVSFQFWSLLASLGRR